jgi:hypothetical protein
VTETVEDSWSEQQVTLMKRCCRFLVPLRLTKIC